MKGSIVCLILTSLLICLVIVNIEKTSAQSQTFPKIHFEPENWTQDMKDVKMTTPEKGLTIRINFENLDEKDYVINYIKIKVEATYEEKNTKNVDYITLENFGIAKNDVASTVHKVDLSSNAVGNLGKWSLRLTYVTNRDQYTFDQKIEPYPFEFKIGSEEELQNEIANKPSSNWIFSPTITVEVSLIGTISVVVAVTVIWNSRRRRGRLR